MKVSKMIGEIIEDEESDRDTVSSEVLEQQFRSFKLLDEKQLSKTAYIHKLCGTESGRFAAGDTDGNIYLVEENESSLAGPRRLGTHKELTEVTFSPREDNLLFSSGHDGVVHLWDTRVEGSVLEYKEDPDINRPFNCMDVSCNGRVLCGGTPLLQSDAFLVFWDSRMPVPLGGYWETLSDDVTQVRFHKNDPSMLATGAEDDLVNFYNIMEQNEDDALISSINVGNSVELVRWLESGRVCCVTQGGDVRVCGADDATAHMHFDKEHVARAIRRSRPDDVYIVDVVQCGDGYGGSDSTPALMAGSAHRDGSVLLLNSSCVRTVRMSGGKRGGGSLTPHAALRGNTQHVRCSHYNVQNNILLTAGENGVLSAWRLS